MPPSHAGDAAYGMSEFHGISVAGATSRSRARHAFRTIPFVLPHQFHVRHAEGLGIGPARTATEPA